MISRYLAVMIGYLLDLILGDPFGQWHPVCAIGMLITACESVLRKLLPKSEKGQLVGGGLLVVLVVGISTLSAALLLWLAGLIHPVLKVVVGSILCYQMLATKSLRVESMKVYHAFDSHNIEDARHAVSMIVGRDTACLQEEGIVKATVETIAENTADGCIAPLCYMALFGPLGGVFYKAVNTMDSMVGYKNDRYLYFGRVAAKMDDVLNYIPARVSAWYMILASGILQMNWKNAMNIYRRDRYNHASPNSAHTEAVMAGALEVQLAGDAIYFGKLYKKKTIGDPIRTVTTNDIRLANRLLYMTSILMFITVVIVEGIIVLI